MKLAIFAALVFSTSVFATEGHPGHENHGKRPEKQGKETTQQVNVSVSQSARAEARAQARASARSSSSATGGNATGGSGGSASGGAGGSANASGGNATATGGQVIVSNAGNGGNGSGLTGRIVPDVSASSPITSTSCRNGITAGGSGNGWGGLLGFFSEDDLCEWRLLEQNYRATGDNDKANAIRSGMTLQRCEKLNPRDREMFGDLCPKLPVQESQNPAFAPAG